MGGELETYEYLAERQFPKTLPSYLTCTCVVHLLNTHFHFQPRKRHLISSAQEIVITLSIVAWNGTYFYFQPRKLYKISSAHSCPSRLHTSNSRPISVNQTYPQYYVGFQSPSHRSCRAHYL